MLLTKFCVCLSHSPFTTQGQERRRKHNQQIIKAKEEKQSRENGWVGRAGGLQVTKSNNLNRKRIKVKANSDTIKNQREADGKMGSISPFS